MINFSFIYDEIVELYFSVVYQCIDSLVLIKIIMIQYMSKILSMRQNIRKIEVNVAYRWFLGYIFNF